MLTNPLLLNFGSEVFAYNPESTQSCKNPKVKACIRHIPQVLVKHDANNKKDWQ
jgi:hypothetical protein